MHKLRYIVFVLLVLVLIHGCKTKQVAVESIEKLSISSNQLVKEIQQAEPSYRTIHIKKMSVNTNFISQLGNVSSAATCQVIKDSAIYVSVKPFLGIEMFFAKLTPKEIIVVDKVRSTIYQTDYEIFEDALDMEIDYKICESLLTNKLFHLQTSNTKKSPVAKAVQVQQEKTLQYVSTALLQEFTLNEAHRIKQIEIKSTTRPEVFKADYDNFKLSNQVFFPNTIDFSVDRKSKIYTLGLNISQIEFDTQVDIPYINTNLYKKGSIESLIK